MFELWVGERDRPHPLQLAQHVDEVIRHDGGQAHRLDRGQEVHDRVGLEPGRGVDIGHSEGAVDDAAVLHVGRQEAERLLRSLGPGHGGFIRIR